MGMMDNAAGWLAPGYFDLHDHRRLQSIVDWWSRLKEIPAERLADRDDYDAVTSLLHAEARLLDSGRFDGWFDLFTNDGVYWLPTDTQRTEANRTLSWMFSDRRGLKERLRRLRAARLLPTSMIHLYTNIEVMTAEPDYLYAFCSFFIQADVGGHMASHTGWNGYILRREVGAWRIVLKRISLHAADRAPDHHHVLL